MMRGTIAFICMLTIVFSAECQTRNIKMPQKPHQEKYTEFSLKNDGYWCSVNISASPSLKFHETSLWSSTLTFVNGYRFHDYLRIGVGIGANYYFANNDKIRNTDIKWTMPLFFNARGNILSQSIREIVPYWSFDIGGAIRDGFFFTPSIGCRIGEQRSAFLISLGYNCRQIKAIEGSSKYRNFVILNLGYEF